MLLRLFIVLLFSQGLYAQYDQSHWRAKVRLQLNYGGLQYFSQSEDWDRFAEGLNEFYHPFLDYGLGLAAAYQLSEKWSIESGLNYQMRSEIIHVDWQFDASGIDPYYGFVQESSANNATSASKVQETQNYLELCFRLNYLQSFRRSSWYGGLGLKSGLYFDGSRYSYEEGAWFPFERISYYSQFDKFQWFALSSVGYRWYLNKKSALSTGLLFQMAFKSISSKSTILNVYPWSIGLELTYDFSG